VIPSPLLLCVTYLITQARQRARRARDGDPESGALSLEWIVIAGILVVAAGAAGAFFTSQISAWEHKIP
jgi:hypothetical protein